MMATRQRLGPLDVLVLSLWCGLAGGLLEVGTIAFCKVLPGHRMYAMSRHFVWMAPLSNLVLFSGIGVFLAMATRCWPPWRVALVAAARFPGGPARARRDEPPDLSVGLGDPGHGDLVAPGAGHRAPSGRAAAVAGAEFSAPRGGRPGPGGTCADEAGSRSGVRRAVPYRPAIPRTCS